MKKNTPINSEKQTILKDFSGLEAICGHVYTPENIDQVVEILKTANKDKKKVIPIGGRTGTAGGYFGKIDIGIDLKNFSYIRRTPQDTFVVGAGTKTGEFNKYLRALKMVVPMTEAPNACIGGAVSMDNPGKPYHESSLVDHIVAITVVSPTGKKIYLRADDEDSLLFYSTIGGEGITGIIIDAEFKHGSLKTMEETLNITGRLLGTTKLMDMYLKESTGLELMIDDFMNGRYDFRSAVDNGSKGA